MDLKQLTAQQRADILARERQFGAQLKGELEDAWERVYARLQWLFQQMTAAERAGRTPDLAWLFEARRLDTLLQSIHQEVDAWAQQANVSVVEKALEAQRLGIEIGLLQLHTRYSDISLFFQRPMNEAAQVLRQRLETGPIAKRFDSLAADAVRRAKATLQSGVNLGWSPARIASKLRYDLGIEYGDAMRISRTEIMQSYRAGTLSTYRANSDVVTGWQWLAAVGACPICRDMDGTMHALDEDFDGSHPNCRCTSVPITKSYADLGFTDIEEAA